MATAAPETDAGLTAFFETRAAAEAALRRLREAGVPEAQLRLTEGGAPETGTGAEAAPDRGRGFFDALGAFLLPDRDREAYAEGLARGGHLLVVEGLAPERQATAARLLEEAGAVDVHDRAADWRAQGWQGLLDRVTAGPDAPGEPRPVQPGFADTPPGYVPEPGDDPAPADPQGADGTDPRR